MSIDLGWSLYPKVFYKQDFIDFVKEIGYF